MRTIAIMGLVLLVGNASCGAFAAGGKNVEPLLCHLVKPLACDARNNCAFSTAEIMHLPEFVKVDVAAMTISGEEPGGQFLTAKIENMQEEDQRLVLYGSENGVGWSMLIAKPKNKMTLTLVDDQVAAVIFGACSRLQPAMP